MLVTAGVALLALGALIYRLRRGYLVVSVVGNSMTPTLHDGQQLLARRWRFDRDAGAPLRRSEIIVFTPPLSARSHADPRLAYRVKRVIAIAGDALPAWVATPAGDAARPHVPPGMVVVRGDNPNSEDSRSYGCVREASIIARVVAATGARRAGARGCRPRRAA